MPLSVGILPSAAGLIASRCQLRYGGSHPYLTGRLLTRRPCHGNAAAEPVMGRRQPFPPTKFNMNDVCYSDRSWLRTSRNF